MNTRGHHWLSNVRLTKYQGLLCENPCITTEVCNTLNPATLLPMSEGSVEHNCVEVLDTVYSSKSDLQDQPWKIVDWELYVDGSSFVNPRGERCAGYVVVTLDIVIEAKSLPQGTSAQKAELIALSRALELIHGALYKERGLLTSGRKEIKYQHEILQLLEAVWKPQAAARSSLEAPEGGHQQAHTSVALGNSRADSAALKAASAPYRKAVTALLVPQIPDLTPTYSKEERDFLQTEGGN
ncbi:Gag-Pol polyprotein [Plecturocebus cupreus]